MPRVGGGAQCIERGRPLAHRGHAHLLGGQHLLEHLEARGVVVDDQGPHAVQPGELGRVWLGARVAPEAGSEPERAAAAGYALEADFTVHQLG